MGLFLWRVWVDFLWRDAFANMGGDKPRKAGANTLRHLFDKFLKGTFRVMEKRQSSCSLRGKCGKPHLLAICFDEPV